jgi:hypothetical protein
MRNGYVIGLDSQEISWVRSLVDLMRHSDPAVGEASREAIRYLQDMVQRTDQARAAS